MREVGIPEMSLERLIAPMGAEEFLRDYWERRPLLIKRGRRDYFDGLLTLEEIDRVITSLNLAYPEIALTDASRTIQKQDYAFETELVDVARLYQHYRDGSTIILKELHYRVSTLGVLCRSMERQLSTRFQTNVYVTPQNAQGFKPHYDTHDVFVLQVHGSKKWSLYNTPVELPFRNQDFDKDKHPVGAVTHEFELEAGDMVYVPRGMVHDARATDEMSVHITLGVLFTSWTELLTEALAQVSLDDIELRRTLPVGFANPGFDRSEARRTFKQLFARIVERADLDRAMDHFANDLISSRHPIIPGQFWQISRLATLAAGDRVRRRKNMLYRLEDTDEGVILHVYGDQISFPVQAREPLRAALTLDEFAISALPGPLDDPGKLVLVRRLVSEGFLEILL